MIIENKIYTGKIPEITSPLGFQYLWAENGIYIHAKNDFFEAIKQCCSTSEGPGQKLEEKLFCKSRVSLGIFEWICREFEASRDKEKMIMITYDTETKEFNTYVPEQSASAVSVEYTVPELKEGEIVILECHSHPNMNAFFSETDDKDNQGFKVYGVFAVNSGKVDDFMLRLGVYGRFFEIGFQDIFEEFFQ